MAPDTIIGTGVDGTTDPIEDVTLHLAAIEEGLARKAAETIILDDLPDTQRPDFEDFVVIDGERQGESNESDQETSVPTPTAGAEPEAEIDLDTEEMVFGISFPAPMLPLDFNSGYWESEPILDPSGDPEAALVRVWLYPPNQPGDPMISDESSPEANTPQETGGTG